MLSDLQALFYGTVAKLAGDYGLEAESEALVEDFDIEVDILLKPKLDDECGGVDTLG